MNCGTPRLCSRAGFALGLGALCIALAAGPVVADTSGAEIVAMVPMRDGVHLWTKAYLPEQVPPGGVPAILRRTPYRYPSSFWFIELKAQFYASRGYAYILQDCRGRFGSEGQFDPFADEVADGQDTTQWIVEQDWSNGRVGTMGSSYDGFTALAAAVDNPLVAAVIADDTTADISTYVRRGGQVSLGSTVAWLYFLDHGQSPNSSTIVAATNALDLGALDQLVLGYTDLYWQAFVASADPVGPFFDERALDVENVCAPVLLIKSSEIPWDSPVEIWRRLLDGGCAEHRDHHRLVITPDGHGFHLNQMVSAPTFVTELILDFLDGWVGEQPIDLDEVPLVLYRAPTDATYHEAPTWPAATSTSVFYLGPTVGGIGSLNADMDGVTDGEDRLDVDPVTMDPCSSSYPALYYATAPLDEPVALLGAPRVELQAMITTPDADFTVMLCEANSDGSLIEITDGLLRARYRDDLTSPSLVNPEELIEFSIDLWSRAYVFQPGSQIVLKITAGSCWYVENPNTGEPLDAQTSRQPVAYFFVHDVGNPMRLTLPIATACPADVTEDHAVNVEDLLEILDGWGTPAGDITGDAATGVSDLLLVLGAWGPCVPCPGDTNSSGAVDVQDLVAVIVNWGQPGGAADVNQDGMVDVQDLISVIGNWGPCA